MPRQISHQTDGRQCATHQHHRERHRQFTSPKSDSRRDLGQQAVQQRHDEQHEHDRGRQSARSCRCYWRRSC